MSARSSGSVNGLRILPLCDSPMLQADVVLFAGVLQTAATAATNRTEFQRIVTFNLLSRGYSRDSQCQEDAIAGRRYNCGLSCYIPLLCEEGTTHEAACIRDRCHYHRNGRIPRPHFIF